MQLVILLLLLSTQVDSAVSAVISQPFQFGVPLDPNGDIYLQWTLAEGNVTFNIEARTQGYVAIGISLGGGMKDADILMAFFDAAGQPRILDMFARGRQPPELDPSQDYVLEKANKNESHITFQFSRKWNTCDPNDVDLYKESNKIIWAVNDNPPVETDGQFDFNYHGKRRGVKFLYLNSPIEFDRTSLIGAKVWEIQSEKATFNNDSDTTYLCKIVKFPKISEKHHIIAYEPVIPRENLKNNHHLALYQCEAGSDGSFNQYLNHKLVRCYEDDFPPQWYNCKYTAMAWGIGSLGFNEPGYVGKPVYPNRDYFYLLETHFDNRAFVPDVQAMMGFKVYYTTNLRKYDSGFLTVGTEINHYTLIPPGQKSWKIINQYTADTFDWSKENLIDPGIKIYAVEHHTHILGAQVYVRHIRNGKELEPITEDLHYNFDFQSTLYLPQEKTILQGDILISTCVYDSSKLSKTVFAGRRAVEEMCFIFFHYYPRNNLGNCFSQPSKSVFRDVYNVTIIGDEFHTDNERNVSFRELVSRPENEKMDKANKLQKLILQGPYDSTCRSNLDTGKFFEFNKTEANGNHVFERLPVKKNACNFEG